MHRNLTCTCGLHPVQAKPESLVLRDKPWDLSCAKHSTMPPLNTSAWFMVLIEINKWNLLCRYQLIAREAEHLHREADCNLRKDMEHFVMLHFKLMGVKADHVVVNEIHYLVGKWIPCLPTFRGWKQGCEYNTSILIIKIMLWASPPMSAITYCWMLFSAWLDAALIYSAIACSSPIQRTSKWLSFKIKIC